MTVMSVALLGLLFLLLPLVAGIVLVVLSRRGGLGYPACGRCKYDLSGSIGVATRCPECGEDFAKVGIVPPRGRRNRIMVWSGVVLIALPLTCVGVSVASLFVGRQQTVQSQRSAVPPQQAVIGAKQPATQPAEEPPPTEQATSGNDE